MHACAMVHCINYIKLTCNHWLSGMWKEIETVSTEQLLLDKHNTVHITSLTASDREVHLLQCSFLWYKNEK